jgi:glycosyltransferase involved in cell wall biosynthesis
MPKVTVLLPVYNGERYLREAIDSVLIQTFIDFELLIIDDGSTDSSLEIIRSYTDSRIRLLRNRKRLKLSGALNRGMDDALGEYIARMDADDICLPQRLATQVEYMDRHQDVGICGSWVKMFGIRGTTVYKAPVGYLHIRAKALFDNPFVHPSVMIRKGLFDQFSLRFDGDYYPTEDFELWARAIPQFPCHNIDCVLLHYRVHPQSMTNSDWNQMDAKGLSIVRRELDAFGCHASEEQLIFHRSIGRQMSRQCQSRDEIIVAEQWLKSLVGLNGQQGKYDEIVFMEEIQAIWFRLCFNSSTLGFYVVRAYLASTLTKNDGNRIPRSGLIIAAVLKASLLSCCRKSSR